MLDNPQPQPPRGDDSALGTAPQAGLDPDQLEQVRIEPIRSRVVPATGAAYDQATPGRPFVSESILITVTTDLKGGTVVVLPDHDARLLAAVSRRGWAPRVDLPYGASEVFPETSAEGRLAAAILAAVAACGSGFRRGSRTDRELAALGDYYGDIVGTSGWDPATQHWVHELGSAEHNAVRTWGGLFRLDEGGYQFSSV